MHLSFNFTRLFAVKVTDDLSLPTSAGEQKQLCSNFFAYTTQRTVTNRKSIYHLVVVWETSTTSCSNRPADEDGQLYFYRAHTLHSGKYITDHSFGGMPEIHSLTLGTLRNGDPFHLSLVFVVQTFPKIELFVHDRVHFTVTQTIVKEKPMITSEGFFYTKPKYDPIIMK